MTSEEIDNFLAVLRERDRRKRAPCISDTTAAYLRYLLRIEKPRNVLEVGTCEGYSAIFMVRETAAWDAHITSFEFSAPSYENACANILACGLHQRVHAQFGDALLLLPMLPNQRFDFAFIDGEKHSTLEFVQRAWPKLVSCSKIVIDDVLKYRTKMQDFWDWIEATPLVHQLVATEEGDALMVLTRT
jgi:predicted O-methyltransferase YrrM